MTTGETNTPAAQDAPLEDALEDVVEMTRDEWLETLDEIGEERGYFEPLGPDHSAIFTDQGTTLLVTFETIDGIMEAEGDGLPMGFDLADAHGWSQLCLLSHEETWFRAVPVFGFFDRLVDDGFFEDFDRVVFYGAGACGYAAAAFSVAAPGATVIALQPQATLDSAVVDWDTRFAYQRRRFTKTRYSYAPDMIEAASRAFIAYDPAQSFDAMHASLFTRPNVSKLRLRLLGNSLERELRAMGILDQMIEAAMDEQLTPALFWKMYRARRGHLPLMRAYLANLISRKRDRDIIRLSRHVLRSYNAPRFRKTAEAAQANLAARGIEMTLEDDSQSEKPKATVD
ncbi:MAG: phosphoadenosine phosphosulfate reductase [Paracoccaceae bacterium]